MPTRKTSVEDKPKKTNGKAKGNVFERKIAKIMTEWTGIKFERVPASGGLHWKSDNRVYGDIVCNDPEFPFVIECKNRQAWNMDSLINGSKEVEKWWKQVTADAEATGKLPMVIFTRNQQPNYIMMRLEDYDDDNLITSGQYPNIPMYVFRMDIAICGEPLTVMKLDDFTRRFSIGFKS